MLVVTSSYPYAIGWADAHLPAILWSAHGGQEFGHALADVLFGDADPAGRLTQTWYRSAGELPDLLDYDIIATDATYLYFRGTPLYPFGHGLSYTTFEYSDLRRLERGRGTGDDVTVSVEVTNTGDRAGDEVVQLYTRQQRVAGQAAAAAAARLRAGRLPPGERRLVDLRAPRGRPRLLGRHRGPVRGRDAPATRSWWAARPADIRLTDDVAGARRAIGPRRALDRPIAAADHDEYGGITLVADATGPRRRGARRRGRRLDAASAGST